MSNASEDDWNDDWHDDFDEGTDNSDGGTIKSDPPKKAVGYKSPPEQHRFRKGHRGGPGRPRGSKSLPNLIRAELDRKVKVKIGGQTAHMSAGEAIVMKMVREGIAGDRQATGQSIKLMEKYAIQVPEDPPPNFSRLGKNELITFAFLTAKLRGTDKEFVARRFKKEDGDNDGIFSNLNGRILSDEEKSARFYEIYETVTALIAELFVRKFDDDLEERRDLRAVIRGIRQRSRKTND